MLSAFKSLGGLFLNLSFDLIECDPPAVKEAIASRSIIPTNWSEICLKAFFSTFVWRFWLLLLPTVLLEALPFALLVVADPVCG